MMIMMTIKKWNEIRRKKTSKILPRSKWMEIQKKILYKHNIQIYRSHPQQSGKSIRFYNPVSMSKTKHKHTTHSPRERERDGIHKRKCQMPCPIFSLLLRLKEEAHNVHYRWFLNQFFFTLFSFPFFSKFISQLIIVIIIITNQSKRKDYPLYIVHIWQMIMNEWKKFSSSENPIQSNPIERKCS